MAPGQYEFHIMLDGEDVTGEWLVCDDGLGGAMKRYTGWYPTWLDGLPCDPNAERNARDRLKSAALRLAAADGDSAATEYSVFLLRVFRAVVRYPAAMLRVTWTQ